MLTKAAVKELPEHAVYTDVVNGGHLLPEKKKYTMKDFKALVKEGYSQVDARWVIICSHIYWHYDDESLHRMGISQHIYTHKFYLACVTGTAML